MKKYILLPWVFITLFTLNSCELADKAKREFDRIKNQYEEFTDKRDRGPRPFEVIFQKDENAKSAIISSQCAGNQLPKYIFFGTQVDAQHRIFSAIQNLYSFPYQGVLKPYWDTRYMNHVSQFIAGSNASHFPNHSELTGLDARNGSRNITVGTGVSQVDSSGSVMQSECVGGAIAAGTTLNLFDAPEQSLVYAGIQSTFSYQIHPNNHIRPWRTNTTGNLLIQASFDKPIYHNFSSNIGGSVSFNIFLYNPKIKQHLNYVIGVYAAGVAWTKEKAGIRFDPTTNIIHVATVIKESSWWSTKSPRSKSIEEIVSKTNAKTKDDGQWNEFYRVNISYQNLLAVLNELKVNPPAAIAGKNFGLSPQDWEVTLVALQYELEEEGGKASFSGSFRGFETYISQLPL